MSADDASEAALVALTRNASATLAADRVRVLAINLGWTVTPSEHRIQTQIDGQPEDWAEREGARQPSGRLLLPDDAARLADFLAFDSSDVMSGSIIDLDQLPFGLATNAPTIPWPA